MQVQLFRSATVGIRSDGGTQILCDPWLTDGAYIGSWHHWPRLEGDEFESVLARQWDAVYISHLHPDHFDRRFLAALGRRQPNCRVVIPAFATPWLRRAVTNCGFPASRIVELESGRPLSVGDVRLTVLRADHCNPELCGVATPCHQEAAQLASIDSLALFEADGQSILNANDALAVSSVWRALQVVGHVDLLLGHFAGAGPYPQCFVDMNEEEKHKESNRVASDFAGRLANAAEVTRARFVLPFAGQYVLGGRLTDLNEWRSVWPMAKVQDFVQERTNAQVITLAPFASFSLTAAEADDSWSEPSEESWQGYRDSLRKVTFPYERKEEFFWIPGPAVEAAFARVVAAFEKSREYAAGSADCAIVLDMGASGSVAMEFLGRQCQLRSPSELNSSNVTTIAGDPRLWRRLIVRRPNYSGFTAYHFNQAEIGSHFEWARQGSYREEFRFLNFLQTP